MALMQDPNFADKGYVPVNVRIKKFRDMYPNGVISTTRLETEAGISFRAMVYRSVEEAAVLAPEGLAAAVGHSFLLTEGIEEATKVEEATETAAIGRALAVLGFEIQNGIASKEEIDLYNSKKEETTEEDTEDEDEEPSEDEAEKEEVVAAEEAKEKPKTETKLKTSRFQKRFVKP